ncbi:MAG TPA: hypothetical protein VM513_34525 [Kofleriaceae bacterium]|jgi:hypothetical protein|nr:hypothetical protein [Kofleriaceae bacterium]
MRKSLITLVLALAAGCGSEIGDSCTLSIDCSPDGDRQCDSSAKEGYCTIQGCDFNTCPDEAVCVSFFSGGFTNRPCESSDDCSLDELCALDGHCVTQKSEQRNCMRTCESNDDCRDGYECRDLQLMIEHGGQPVMSPGQPIDENAPKFCAAAPA